MQLAERLGIKVEEIYYKQKMIKHSLRLLVLDDIKLIRLIQLTNQPQIKYQPYKAKKQGLNRYFIGA